MYVIWKQCKNEAIETRSLRWKHTELLNLRCYVWPTTCHIHSTILSLRLIPPIHSIQFWCIYSDSIQLLFCHFPSSAGKFMAKVKDLYVLEQWVYFSFHFFLVFFFFFFSVSLFIVFENLFPFYYHFDKATISFCIFLWTRGSGISFSDYVFEKFQNDKPK